jgi:NTE family protein
MLDAIPDGRLGLSVSLVLAGGAALGAYEAGAYEALHEEGGPLPDWLAGSSIGAVNAAIIAGNPPERRVERLREFWNAAASDPMPMTSFWFGLPGAGPRRQAYNLAGVLQTLCFGRPGMFRPRLAPGPRAGANDVSALFDLAPMRLGLERVIDFDLLNNGPVRLTVAATDVVSGERVVFDTGRGHRIGPEHVMASSAMLPFFAPIEVEGWLLADGGLSANAPVDLVLDTPATSDRLCFVVDLFAREGSRPQSLAASVSRATDLAFGNQSRRILQGQQTEHRLRAMIGQLAARLPAELRDVPDLAVILAEGTDHQTRLLFLSYRAGLDELGPGKMLDFSRASLADRWQAGGLEMQAALRTLRGPQPHAPEPEPAIECVRA